MDVTITVWNDNRKPEWSPFESVPDSIETGQLLEFTVSANDSDIATDKQSLTYFLVGDQGDAAVDPETGLFSGTPTPSEIGEYIALTFGAEDNLHASPPDATIDIRVVRSNEPPTLEGWTPALGEIVSWDVALATRVLDADGDSVNVRMEYSTDADTTWRIASVTGQTDTIASGKKLELSWDTERQFSGLVLTDSVYIRLTPYDWRDYGPTLTATVVVLNLPCDWAPEPARDGHIGIDDFVALDGAWHRADGTPYEDWEGFDIGPYNTDASPELPNVTIEPDTSLDIRDLMTFAMLWDWAWENNRIGQTSRLAARAAREGGDLRRPITVSDVNERNGTADLRITPPNGCRAARVRITFGGSGRDTPRYRSGAAGGLSLAHRDEIESSVEVWSIIESVESDTGIVIGELVALPTAEASDVTIEYEFVDHAGVPLTTGSYHRTILVNRMPEQWAIQSVAPNPFNPSTTIRFGVPRAEPFAIHVYDILGQRVATLADGVFEPGEYSLVWHGVDSRRRAVGSGVYIVELRSAGVRKLKRITLLR